jgi:hypothetical protein
MIWIGVRSCRGIILHISCSEISQHKHTKISKTRGTRLLFRGHAIHVPHAAATPTYT